ncbi:hypothetical protein TESG_04932 [Trichophyton tonsurans CBS 112818]|uniref:PHD-type domain-containing protein n=1 Tax=Trichophyton tonsurans (strain CBS 112818) TaxID=647933 RepID=F2S1S5_TRIT1|nr:hypothetical protein TESG_04932 [Trichophyton tonsurans CBS 112818]
MAPRLRSSSRTTSRNNTRPSSPHSAPASRPSSSSTSDTARPKKQRKTGTETRSPVDVVEEEERQAERKPAGSQMDTVLEQPEQAVGPQMAALPGSQQLATAAGLSQSQDTQLAGQSSSVLPAPEQSTETEQPVPAAAPRADEETWVEPPVAIPKTTCRGYGLNRGGPYGSMLPLGTRPTLAARRRVGLEPPAPTTTANRVTKRKGGRAAKPKQTTKNADERPSTASTSAEDAAALSDSSRAEGIIQGVLEHEERSRQQPPAIRITRSRAAGKDKLDDSADSSQSAGPAVPSSRKYTSEKLMDILGSAISRAEESQDSKVAGGLRWIKEASASDPFLLGVLEGAINRSADAHHRSAFQALMKDAVKRAQAQPEQQQQQQQQLDDSAAATDMVRTASATTTSSLSTAKSLDADAFAPVAAEPDSGNAPTTTSAKGKGARAPRSRTRGGRRRAGPSRANAAPPTNSAFSRKRKLEEDPVFSEEAVAAKRRALEEATIAVTDEAEESNVRTAMEPPQGWIFPGPSVPSDSEGQGSTRPPAAVVPAPKDRAARKPNTVGGSSSKRVRKPRVQADEIDNIDFCRACGGNGQLLCCDGCVDSFHFTCLRPPVDPKSPPAGQWFCPACEKKGLLGGLAEVMDSVPQTGFSLPAEVREFFAEVETGPGGEYRDVRALPEGSTRAKPARGSRGGVVEEQDPLRILDSHGKVIACVRCGLTSENRRPVILCDYCPSAWHLDCLDPPMANPPRQKPGSDKPYHYWRCPNHLEDALEQHYPGRVRRPRNPKYVDIEVLPDADEESVIKELDQEAVVLRVRECGLVHGFITHVLSERAAEEEARAKEAGDETRTQGEGQDEVPSAVPTFSQLGSAEQDAVMGLMDISGNSGAKRAEQIMSGLIDGTPEGFRACSNELEILQAVQELVGKRIAALTPTSGSTN